MFTPAGGSQGLAVSASELIETWFLPGFLCTLCLYPLGQPFIRDASFPS